MGLAYQEVKIPCSMHLYSHIQDNLPTNQSHIPWQYDARFSTVTCSYNAVICSHSMELWLFLKNYNNRGKAVAEENGERGRECEVGNSYTYKNIMGNKICIYICMHIYLKYFIVDLVYKVCEIYSLHTH